AGELTWPAPPPKLPAEPPKPKDATPITAPKGHGHGSSEPMSVKSLATVFGVGAVLFLLVGMYAPASFLSHFTVFVLACFIGYMVVWNVTPSLHTPLMSVTNAISSIIAIGALVQVAPPLADSVTDRPSGLILFLAFFALTLTAVNMFGGVAVTRGMLAMFRKKGDDNDLKHGLCLVHRRHHPLHPQPGRARPPRECTPGQPVRHDRHGARGDRHRVRSAGH